MQLTREQLIKRILVYASMSVSVIVIVWLLMLAVLGYSFNSKDNRLEQGGLLQFASVPSGATITLDQQQLGSHTPTKTTADASSHTVMMNLKGYRPWSKTIDLKAGEIGWLSYARLVPTDPKAENVRSFPALAGMLGSPDRKWIALIEDTAKPDITIANVQNSKVELTALILPVGTYTQPSAGKVQAFSLDSWSQNGQFMLVKHVYDDTKAEWLLVNREDATKTKDISMRLGLVSDKVQFADSDGKTALALTDAMVRRLNFADETLSRPLFTNGAEFSPQGDNTVLYTTMPDPTTKQRIAGYMTKDMEVGQTLATFPDDGQQMHVAMADYFSEHYVATAHGTRVTVRTGDLPTTDNKGSLKNLATFTAPAPVLRLTFSSNGRFVIAETGAGYVVYDLELSKTDATILKDVAAPARPLRWLDAFMTWYDSGAMLRLYEFDGANQQNIVPVAEGYDVVMSPDQKYLYSIGHDAAGLSLQRVRMVLN
jgi:PEGA domain